MVFPSKSDISIYFDIINSLNARTVLDIGMLLKSAGCVCRQYSDKSISNQIVIDGVDLISAYNIPVYHHIYHHIFSPQQEPYGRYVLSNIINLKRLVNPEQHHKLWMRALIYSDYVLCNYEDAYHFVNNHISLKYEILKQPFDKYALIINKM